jgi:lipopolysaccharide/colanic/teichoic acid biosynthesis glycosyltransferase
MIELSGQTWLRFRRPIDFVASLILLSVTGPLGVVLAVLVRVFDGRPAVVHLPRVGADGAVFRILKIRSMVSRPDNAAEWPEITGSSDSRVTRLGGGLRRWRLDELPQLINVIKGEMALIGPRPEDPRFVEMTDSNWSVVLSARPGIAGLTQLLIHETESNTIRPESWEDDYRRVLAGKLRTDAWYVENASPSLDSLIVISLFEQFILRRGTTLVHRMRGVPCLTERVGD